MAASGGDQDDEFGWILEPGLTDTRPGQSTGANTPNWRALGFVVVALTAMIAVFALGQSTADQTANRSAAQALVGPASPIDEPVPEPTTEPEVEATPTAVPATFFDMIGEGHIVNELVFTNGGRAVLFCRDGVPFTDIAPMLTMMHFESSPRNGEQLIGVEELAAPRLASNSCKQCGGDIVTLDGEDVIAGSCIHGAPFSAGSAYVIAQPGRPDHTPLALHLSCGITSLHTDADRVIIDAEAPLIRGLHQTRFPLPSVGLTRVDGEFIADDIELLNWNCDLFRSTQLSGVSRLRDEPPRSISYDSVDSAIGPIGVHPPMVVGLSRESCSQLTNAWWDREAVELATGSPIADLIGIAAPPGHEDWFYSCQIVAE